MIQNRKAFLQAVQQPETSLDLGYCALLVSQAFNPGLNIQQYQEILQTLVEQAIQLDIGHAEDLIYFINKTNNFHGNPDEYYQVENSLLDKVLDSRLGIPISLAIVYLSIGNATKLSVRGIGFPGHFLVEIREPTATQPVFIDPFAARIVTKSQCYRLLGQLYQGEVAQDEKYFAAASNFTILLRLLENIKAIYLKQEKAELALTCLDYQLLIRPEDGHLLSQQQQLLAHISKRGGQSSVIH